MQDTADLGKGINDDDDDDDVPSTAEETSKKRENLIQLKETVYETLGKAWPTSAETQGLIFLQLLLLL